MLGLAALTLFEVTGADGYLADARAHAAEALANWDDKGGGFYQVAANADPALPALKIGYDGQMPSGNAAMAELMGRLYFMTGDGIYRDHAKRTLAAFSGGRWIIPSTMARCCRPPTRWPVRCRS